MKLHKIMLACAAIALLATSCEEKAVMPGNNDHNQDSLQITPPDPDPEGVDVPETTITVYQAVDIAKKLPSGEVTPDTYYIKGWVNSFNSKEHAKDTYEENFKKYGNEYVYLSPQKSQLDSDPFYCYRLLGVEGAKLPDHECILIGDFIVIQCKITNYNGIYESSGTCAMHSTSNAHYNEILEKANVVIEATCAEAKDIALALDADGVTDERYAVTGYVQKEGYDNTISRGQQKMFWIADTKDGGKVLEAYWCNVPNEQAVPVGAKVRIVGQLMNYSGTVAEIKNGNVTIVE